MRKGTWPPRASERPVAMRSARDAAARPPSCRQALARSSSPCCRPTSARPAVREYRTSRRCKAGGRRRAG
eukprot:703105-Prymnesium_polylepis.1